MNIWIVIVIALAAVGIVDIVCGVIVTCKRIEVISEQELHQLSFQQELHRQKLKRESIIRPELTD